MMCQHAAPLRDENRQLKEERDAARERIRDLGPMFETIIRLADESPEMIRSVARRGLNACELSPRPSADRASQAKCGGWK